jgi:hypothetical protein
MSLLKASILVIDDDFDVLQPDDIIFSPIESSNQNTPAENNETKLSTIEKKNTILRVFEETVRLRYNKCLLLIHPLKTRLRLLYFC